MKILCIALVCIICGFGFLRSFFQLVQMVIGRDQFTTRWTFIEVITGQAIMLAAVILVAVIAILQILKF